METTLILLAIIALAALIAAPTTYMRMRRRLDLANETHAQILTNLEREHDERLARLQRDAEQSTRFAHHKLATEVLPVIDALDEASKYAATKTIPSPQSDNIQHGVTLAKKQLLQALERHGIEYIAPQSGDSFDPDSHEAVHMVEDTSLPNGKISQCLRAGYRQENRVLRSAMVEVVSNPSQKPSTLIDEPPEPSEPSEDPS